MDNLDKLIEQATSDASIQEGHVEMDLKAIANEAARTLILARRAEIRMDDIDREDLEDQIKDLQTTVQKFITVLEVKLEGIRNLAK